VRKPRVVYLDHVAQLSGAELALLRLLPSVRDAEGGIEPYVVLAEHGPLVEKFRQAGIGCEVLELNPRTGQLRKDTVKAGLPLRAVWDTLVYTVRVARLLRRLDADLVHTNSLKAHLYGGVAARLVRLPQIWHTRDRIAPDYLPMPAVRLMRLVARNLPAAIIANSQATLETVTASSAMRRVVASPVVISDPVLPLGGDGRRGARFTVGLVGRLTPWKGQDLFLRAFATAFPGGDQRAVIVGSSMFGETEYAEGLPRLAAELGIADRVEFTGFVEDVAGQLARLDVLVHCSTVPEPFGQVVIEGMAAGLPVVAADAGGPAEIVQNGVTGLLTTMGDEGELAAALRRLAEHPQDAARLAAAGRRESERYRPEAIAGQLTALYAEVLTKAQGDRRWRRRRDRSRSVHKSRER
jgi:glycosyltransferase involved in cell wall biosynthesis